MEERKPQSIHPNNSIMARYSVIYQTASEEVVDSRHAQKEYAEERREFCENLLHKLNVSSVDVTVRSL
jgi:hypothetical protein